MTENKFFSINIRSYIALGDHEEAGEPALNRMISGLSCPKNLDVEYFLKHNAMEFAKKSQSVTHLVFSMETRKLLGYFTIGLKSLTVRNDKISNTMRKKFLRISELDEESNAYTMPAYLIAQIGKNYANGVDKDITGAELLELALDVIKAMQYMGGGVVAFLECENNGRLLSFYNKNNFRQFDTRQSSSGKHEPHELVQLMRFI